MLLIALGCKVSEDTAVPDCDETPRSIQVGPDQEPFSPFEGDASVVQDGSAWIIPGLARVGGLLVQDEDGLHSLYVDVDVQSENSTTGAEGEHRVACTAGYALVPVVIPVPVKDAAALTATITVADEQGLSAFAQVDLSLTWP